MAVAGSVMMKSALTAMGLDGSRTTSRSQRQYGNRTLMNKWREQGVTSPHLS
jgi:hypothetical protein